MGLHALSEVARPVLHFGDHFFGLCARNVRAQGGACAGKSRDAQKPAPVERSVRTIYHVVSVFLHRRPRSARQAPATFTEVLGSRRTLFTRVRYFSTTSQIGGPSTFSLMLAQPAMT